MTTTSKFCLPLPSQLSPISKAAVKLDIKPKLNDLLCFDPTVIPLISEFFHKGKVLKGNKEYVDHPEGCKSYDRLAVAEIFLEADHAAGGNLRQLVAKHFNRKQFVDQVYVVLRRWFVLDKNDDFVTISGNLTHAPSPEASE